MINVHALKQVQHLLWRLQKTQPRTMQLEDVEKWSANEQQHVLDLLFPEEPALPPGVPLYINLLEFGIGTHNTSVSV